MPLTTVGAQKTIKIRQKPTPALKSKKGVMPANLANKRITKIIKFWLPVLLIMGFIFYASSLPAEDIPPLFPSQDFAFHLIIYLALSYFFIRALKNTYTNIAPAKAVLFTVIFASLYGLTDEFHQLFVVGRNASIFDLFIDSIGSFIGALLYR